MARALPQADRRAAERGGATTSSSTSRSRAAWRCATTSMPTGIDADRLHDGQPDEAGHRPSSATTAWPASRARDFRWERGDIKSISLLGNVLARQMSADRGAVETIMFRDGFLTEASASQRLGRPRGRAARPAEERARARRHPLRADRASCARSAASPTTCARFAEAEVARRRRDPAQLGDQGGAAGDDARRRSRSATARCAASPGRCTRGCTRPTSAPSRRSRSERCAGRFASADRPNWRDERPDARHPAEQSLIEYPSRFPIKVMGANVDGFVHAVTDDRAAVRPGLRRRDDRAARRARAASTWA